MIDIKSTSLNQSKRTENDNKLIEELDKTKSIKITTKKGDIVILNMCVFSWRNHKYKWRKKKNNIYKF